MVGVAAARLGSLKDAGWKFRDDKAKGSKQQPGLSLRATRHGPHHQHASRRLGATLSSCRHAPSAHLVLRGRRVGDNAAHARAPCGLEGPGGAG